MVRFLGLKTTNSEGFFFGMRRCSMEWTGHSARKNTVCTPEFVAGESDNPPKSVDSVLYLTLIVPLLSP